MAATVPGTTQLAQIADRWNAACAKLLVLFERHWQLPHGGMPEREAIVFTIGVGYVGPQLSLIANAIGCKSAKVKAAVLPDFASV